MMPIFKGAGVAIITPMDEDQNVNYDKLEEIIDEQIEGGTDAIVIVGTTGEGSTLTMEEHSECIRKAVEFTRHRVPVVAGTGSNCTKTAIQLTKEAEEHGADAALVVTPYYNKTTQKGLVAHFTAIANAVKIPIILYNVPSRTGTNIQPKTAYELSKVENIVALKAASGNISQIMETAHLCQGQLDIYSGNDDQIVPIMAIGGKGVISVLSNCVPKETHEITQLCLENKFDEATKLAFKYLPLAHALFNDVNPIPVKEALNIMGFKAGECRMPLIRSEEAKIEELRKALDDLGLVGCIK
jgi:4-hydroxy-tetrahydrodipicolinate synthase